MPNDNAIFIREYYAKIKSGEIKVSKWIIKAYEMIMPVINNEDDKYVFDEEKADLAIHFIENYCRQSKGKWAGKPLELMLFQKAKIQVVFGIVHRATGFRRFTEVFDLRARKNGKSVEQSAVALFMLVLDAEMGAEIYSAATVKEQAKRIWEEARSMVEQDPELRAIVKHRVFPAHEIHMPSTGSSFKALSSNIKTFDGLNASCAVIDEAHALSRQIYDLMKQSMSTREQPLLNIITTAGYDRGGLFDDTFAYAKKILEGAVINDTYFPLLYVLDNDAEIKDEAMWVKANPGIDVIKNRDELRRNVERMVDEPNFASTVKVKDFNILDVEPDIWLTFDELNNETVYELEAFNGDMAIGSFDLSRTGDLTQFSTMYYDTDKDTKVFETMYWMPEAKYKRMESSKIPYRQWVDRGLIRLCPGNTIDYHMIADYVYDEMAIGREITYLKIPYDAYSAIYLVKELQSMGFSELCLMRVQQGFKSLSVPMQMLESDLKDKKITYQNNPVTKWCLSNVELEQDRNGNFLPKKTNKTSERKIDGAVGMINCYAGLNDVYEAFIKRE